MYSELRQTMCSVKDGIEKEYKLVLAYLFWSAICTYWGVWNVCGILEFYGMEAVRLDSEGDTDQLGQPEQRLLRLYGRTERRLLPHRGSRHFLHVCDQDDDPLCTDRYFHVVSKDPDPAVGSARIGGRAGEGRGNPGVPFPFFRSAQHLAGACDIYRACAGRNRRAALLLIQCQMFRNILQGYEGYFGIRFEVSAGDYFRRGGKITNEYSYVVVNITVQNKAEEPITDLLWGYLKLKTFETGDFIGEVRYLGEETPRAYGHEYSMETFEAGETKSYPLIFFMPDEMVKNEELYLEINATGIAYDTSDAEFSVMRYIILN